MFGISAYAQAPFAALAGSIFNASIEESASGADVVVSATAFLGSVQESSSAVETTSSVIDFAASIHEQAEIGIIYIISPELGGFGASAFATTSFSGESSGGFVVYSEIVTATVDFAVSVVEAVNIVESSTASVDFVSSVVESMDAADVDSALVVFLASVNEYVVGNDDSVTGFNSYTGNINEAVDFVDQSSAAVDFGVAVQESAEVFDQTTSLVDFAASVAESIGGTDASSALVDWLVSVQESGTTVDVINAVIGFLSLVQEAMTADPDVVVAASIFGASIAEDVNGSDEASTSTIFNGVVSEAVEVADEVDPAGSVYNVSVPESASVEDEYSASVDWLVQIQESVVAADAFVGKLLWDTINTYQQTTWNVIENAQLTITINQGGAFAEGSFGSGPFVGVGSDASIVINTTNWETINTSQSTNWELIETLT